MIYVYSRVSSGKQIEGLSLSSQSDAEMLDGISKKFNTEISDRVYIDEGKSAYSGKNLQCELGVLLEDIRSKKIR